MKNFDKLCLRCGKCCRVFDGSFYRDCKFLIRYENDKTRCMIYEYRLGVDTGFGSYCKLRINVLKHFDGCPFNSMVANVKEG